MSQSLFTWRCAVVVNLVLGSHCIAAQPTSNESRDDELIAALHAAHAQWLNDVQFVCTYSFLEGRSASIANALNGLIELELPHQQLSGVFNKAFGMVRCSGDYSVAAREMNRTDSQRTLAYVDFDEVSSHQVALSYIPGLGPDDLIGSATFFDRQRTSTLSPVTLDPHIAGWNSLRRISPLSIAGWAPDAYLAQPEGMSHSSVRINSSDGRQVTVELRHETAKYFQIKQVDVDLSWSVPAIRRASLHREYKTGKIIDEVTEASEFVECPGGRAPTLIRRAITLEDPRYAHLPVVLSEWKSDDLGERTPTEADFDIPIAPNTQIRGTNNAQKFLAGNILRLRDVSIRDLDEGIVAEHGQSVTASRTIDPRVWLLSANVLVVIILLAYVIRRRRNAMRS